jgi:exopolysaccharide biosynthesis protein
MSSAPTTKTLDERVKDLEDTVLRAKIIGVAVCVCFTIVLGLEHLSVRGVVHAAFETDATNLARNEAEKARDDAKKAAEAAVASKSTIDGIETEVKNSTAPKLAERIDALDGKFNKVFTITGDPDKLQLTVKGRVEVNGPLACKDSLGVDTPGLGGFGFQTNDKSLLYLRTFGIINAESTSSELGVNRDGGSVHRRTLLDGLNRRNP